MSIKADVKELESIRFEIKSLNARRKMLGDKAKIVEARITDYLKSKNTPGVKNNGLAVVLHEKPTSAPKKTKDRDMDAQLVLERYGIKDSQRVLEEIMNARKGEEIIKEKLQIHKYKDGEM